MKTTARGFTLVELMVALAIAAITGVVVLQVLTTYQTRRQTVSGSNDAEINVSLGMFAVEREVRMAGAGYTVDDGTVGVRCQNGINIISQSNAYNGNAPMPVRIIDGGGNAPDQIEIMRSNAEQGLGPSQLTQGMSAAIDDITVSDSSGFSKVAANQANGTRTLALVVAADPLQLCTMLEVTKATPVSADAGNVDWFLEHSAEDSPYNPEDPTVAFDTPMTYGLGDGVVNLGNFGIRRFEIVCNDGDAPSATNSCDLKWYNVLEESTPTMANTESVASQVVDLQAQYGIADADSNAVSQWVDADGSWAGFLGPQQISRIKAVRVAIVTRSNREGGAVAPTSLVLWPDDALGDEKTYDPSGGEQNYRYQTLSVVIPLINVIWSGS
ncbi:MAG: PilW family protein [Nevskiaceae bacterium]|jgi:type IV pilus assembly protein PilW|nr:PilW family protein [Nevskiaceae bacterium]